MAGEGRAVWTVRPIEDVESIRVAALLGEGMSIRDIAEETGIPSRPSTGSRRSSTGTLWATPVGQQKSSRSNDMAALSRCPIP